MSMRTGIVSLEMTSDGSELYFRVPDAYARFHSSWWQSRDEFQFLAGSL